MKQLKNVFGWVMLLLLSGCLGTQSVEKSQHGQLFFVGTYTDGASQGIYRYQLDGDSLSSLGLAAKSVNPSFLALTPDKQIMLAVNETDHEGTGTVESFEVSDDGLSFISSSPTGGAHPCFVTVNRKGVVLVANYSGGNVGLLSLNKSGALSPVLDVQQHFGGSVTPRQETAHVHSAWFLPRSNQVISVDLGKDELIFYTLDKREHKLVPTPSKNVLMAPGDGPRHLAFHPTHDWIYVLNELSCSVTQLQKTDADTYEIVKSVSTLPEGYAEPNTSADIHISSDGKFLYASNRGHNSLAIYSVDEVDGSLKSIGFESVMGDGPRNFTLTPDESQVVVANQYSNNLVLFNRDKETGVLTYVSQATAPNPVCVLFW